MVDLTEDEIAEIETKLGLEPADREAAKARLFNDRKRGARREAAYGLLIEHRARNEIPTNVTFLFYELEQRGLIPKKYDGDNPKTGKPYSRTPRQDISDATMDLRKSGLIPWDWLDDETRDVSDYRFAATGADYLRDSVDMIRLNQWGDREAPLIICEARGVKGALGGLAYEST
jgi:hypothetical protein